MEHEMVGAETATLDGESSTTHARIGGHHAIQTHGCELQALCFTHIRRQDREPPGVREHGYARAGRNRLMRP